MNDLDNEFKKIESYAARKGYIIKRARAKTDGVYNVSVKKAAAGQGALSEAEFDFSDFLEFKQKLLIHNKKIRKNRQAYAKILRLKNSKNRREIGRFEKRSERARNIRKKYNGFFNLALEQIKDSFENKNDRCTDFLELFSEQYLGAYSRILPYNHGISRKANLYELNRAYKKAAKKLFLYIAQLIKTYRKNPANDYKNAFLSSAHPFDGVSMLDRHNRLSYKRLGQNFARMCVKAAEYATNFGVNYKSVAEKNFFSEYVSALKPFYYEDIDYLSFKNIVTLCVNKNTKTKKKRKPWFLLLPALTLGFSGRGTQTGLEPPTQPETLEDPYAPPSANPIVKHFLKPALPLLALLFLLTGSSALQTIKPMENSINKPNLDFLPFGIGDKIDEGLGVIASRFPGTPPVGDVAPSGAGASPAVAGPAKQTSEAETPSPAVAGSERTNAPGAGQTSEAQAPSPADAGPAKQSPEAEASPADVANSGRANAPEAQQSTETDSGAGSPQSETAPEINNKNDGLEDSGAPNNSETNTLPNETKAPSPAAAERDAQPTETDNAGASGTSPDNNKNIRPPSFRQPNIAFLNNNYPGSVDKNGNPKNNPKTGVR